MMLKVNDYVEGCEFYGNKIAYIRGWVTSVRYNSENHLTSCEIKCDDSYGGFRGNSLIIDENYPIHKVEYKENWFHDLNRFERGRSYYYRKGLDLKFLTDKDVVRFWDVDGVLGIFAYGKNGINVCEESYFQEYMKKCNPYMDAVAPEVLKEFMFKFTDSKNNYVVSQVKTEIERDKKRDFILKNYKDFILEENIFFVDSKNKYDIIKEILKTKYKSIKTKHCLIDDNPAVLSCAQDNGIMGIHLSSLLLLMTLDKKADYVEIFD